MNYTLKGYNVIYKNKASILSTDSRQKHGLKNVALYLKLNSIVSPSFYIDIHDT